LNLKDEVDMAGLDDELCQGLVSAEGLRKLIDAEIYGTATPMQWLEKRLHLIESVIQSGRPVTVDAGSQAITLGNWEQYAAWCAKTLPDAYSCFVKERR
jgi:hypothetical protein